ncbi:hypothetical protein QZH41_006826 [Actinostola sp. cb2023]|nr:hypothetical protein QZH41_006826 [Actinostola sp. cb2023]
MERFLNDLASASLSAEHETRRITLEKKILTVKKISPPSSPAVHSIKSDDHQTQGNTQAISTTIRPRAWSCPSLDQCTDVQARQDDQQNTVALDKRKTENAPDEIAALAMEKKIEKPQDKQLAASICTETKFKRLQQAYLDSLKTPRRRTKSEPQVRTPNLSTTNHRRPNLEYIQDMAAFLKDIKLAPLSERHVKERNRVEVVVHNLQIKIAEHVHEIQRVNGVKSPRPIRKNSPSLQFSDDRTHAHSSHFHILDLTEKSEYLQPRLPHRLSYSPEAKRRLEVTKPKIRPRSISCPEIRYTSHSWKTSLPKVPENEEFIKEDEEKENKMRK